MPGLPSATVYVEHLVRRNQGNTLEKVVVASPFVGRAYDPPIEAAHGRHVLGVERLGKRIVIALQGQLYLSIHLMVTGRFRWQD